MEERLLEMIGTWLRDRGLMSDMELRIRVLEYIHDNLGVILEDYSDEIRWELDRMIPPAYKKQLGYWMILGSSLVCSIATGDTEIVLHDHILYEFGSVAEARAYEDMAFGDSLWYVEGRLGGE